MKTKKREARLNKALDRLFSAEAFGVPRSLKDLSPIEYFERHFANHKGQTIWLSQFGVNQLKTIVRIVGEELFPSKLFNEDDLRTSVDTVLKALMSRLERPDDGLEFMDMVLRELGARVDNFECIAALAGVSMQCAHEIDLGAVKLIRPSLNVFDECVAADGAIALAAEQMSSEIWVKASLKGTASVAQSNFAMRARLTAGLLSLIAAMFSEWGATVFHFSPVMSPAKKTGAVTWAYFPESTRLFTVKRVYSPGRMFRITDELYGMLKKSDWFDGLVELLARDPKNDLEEAIVRALYWYSDAQRDDLREMQLVKFWSCIECFFSISTEGVTSRIMSCLPAILVFGDYRFVPIEEYGALKAAVSRFYDQRSKAVHDARHGHVTQRSVARVSIWAAWLVLSVMAFTKRGYETREDLVEQSLRLDRLANKKTVTAL